jgi:putative spermidine/putrescine transport system substrate-binding protein
MPDKVILPRRTLIAGALAMPAILGRAADAEAGRVVVGTWGGDYARLLHENVEQPLLVPKGIDVVQDANDEPPRIAKIYAQAKLARGALDVACMQAVGGFRVNDSGLVETLDATKVPNLAHLRPELRTDYFAPHIYSLQVLIYNPDKVPTPPQSFSELLDPKYAGKVGIGDQGYLYALMAAGQYASGNHTDFDAARSLLVKLNANGMRLYPSTDSIATGLASGEIIVGLMWLARVVMWQNAGVPVKAAFPKEGCITYISGMVVPKNAPDKDAAFVYLNAMLEPSAQKLFAERMGYLPTVDNCQLTGKTAEQLAFPDPPPKAVVIDYAATSKAQPDLLDWWKKTIQHS